MVIFSREGFGGGVGKRRAFEEFTSDKVGTISRGHVIGHEMLSLKLLKEVSNRSKAKKRAKKKRKRLSIVQRND